MGNGKNQLNQLMLSYYGINYLIYQILYELYLKQKSKSILQMKKKCITNLIIINLI